MHLIRPWLYIAAVRETSNRTTMYTYNIGAILQLASPALHPGIENLYVPVEDGIPFPHDKLRTAITFAREQKAAGHKIAIGCGAGISRSVTVAVAVLHEEENISLLDAFEQIVAIHPDAMPHLELIRSLGSYYADEDAARALLKRIWLVDSNRD
ncbi:MAG: dual specificity protein phosphatase family protein [Chloroflexi bacterium]|nr:dual specificity protein phosphatase family protein [Chloroflexota bacterium]MCC6894315.1 dual specificity protein phosphatase family protein [Anaerolineae bacterium]